MNRICLRFVRKVFQVPCDHIAKVDKVLLLFLGELFYTPWIDALGDEGFESIPFFSCSLKAYGRVFAKAKAGAFAIDSTSITPELNPVWFYL